MDLRPIAQTLSAISKNSRYENVIHSVSAEVPLARSKTHKMEITFREQTTSAQRLAVEKRIRHLFTHPKLLAALVVKHSWAGRADPEGTKEHYAQRAEFEKLSIIRSESPLIRKNRAPGEHGQSLHIIYPRQG